MTDVQTLLEKVLDAGTNTIWAELRKLRGLSIEEKDGARKRWVWELIQNASDCAKEGGVNISLDFEGDILKFSHDGDVFSYKNLLDLITQISSKQSSDEEKTGKFGTGFISTHLLSEKILLKSYFNNFGDQYIPFEILLDRSGKTYEEIKSNIEKELRYIENLKNDHINEVTVYDKRHTTFIYNIDGVINSHEAVHAGVRNLIDSIPFILAFNKKINSISYNNICYSISNCTDFGDYVIMEITNTEKLVSKIAIYEEENVTVSFLVKNDDYIEVNTQNKEIPKLFCQFPLIGTENFCFPLVINSSEFDVERERNAILEGSDINGEIMNTALKLYRKIIMNASDQKWGKSYNLCLIPKNKNSSFQNNIYKEIKDIYERAALIETNFNGNYHGLEKYIDENNKERVHIPLHEVEEYNDAFWNLSNTIVKFFIPTIETYKDWSEILNSKFTLKDFNESLLCKNENINKMLEVYNKTEPEMLDWLNSFYELWEQSYTDEVELKKAYVLNQNNEFKLAKELYVDLDIDEKLKEIVKDLGEEIKGSLVSKDIKISERFIDVSRDNKYIAEMIEKKVDEILSKENSENIKRSSEHQITFNKLTNWFLENPEQSEMLFKKLYSKRTLLSSLEETINRFKIAEKIESNNIKYEDLDQIINNHHKLSDILDGIDSISDSEIIAQLKHLSENRLDYYLSFIEKLGRSKIRIHSFLKKNPKYIVPESLEIWESNKYSKTAFPVTKDGEEISIVIRPSDGNKIIFHEDIELEILDGMDYELWTDNGEDNPRNITLGNILKTTGITVIPLKNLYEN
ncbi:hypothetical protein V6B14_12730 [Sporosarcina psychrophila]|uniref:sacsin N-terminal ATP-binding-like domain-containing protein n=1 Tax=Sporosarcina psychrophila TaxID=1476 RepID=UPI0030D4A84A